MRLTDWGLHTHTRTQSRVPGQGRTVREWKLSTVHLHHPVVAAQVFGFLAHLFKVGKAAGGRREREMEGWKEEGRRGLKLAGRHTGPHIGSATHLVTFLKICDFEFVQTIWGR